LPTCRAASSGRPGLEAVERQLEDVIVVLRAEQQRRMAGSVIRRPAWKNLVLAGPAGSGKSRAAAAVGCVYRELGLLSSGRLNEVSAMDLAGATRAETAALMGAVAARAAGCVLMIKDADARQGLPDRGQHVSWELYKKLSEYRDGLRDELAVILAGDGEPLRKLLYAAPPLAARFSAVIEFPGYTPVQLTSILNALAADAGLALTAEAERKAAGLLAQAEADHPSGNARLAVRLLNQIIAAQARRVTASPQPQNPGALGTVIEADIPENLACDGPPSDGAWSGQYL
jgi:AAA lid domain-containing protein/ATPase family protein associated with various cellular activities (AAA)